MRAMYPYPTYYASYTDPQRRAEPGGPLPPVPMMYPPYGTASMPTATPPAAPGAPGPASGIMEESYIENILRYNHGKIGTFYMTFQGNSKWNAMVFKGRVETAGRDHIIISDPQSGKRYLLLMSNLDWVEFDDKINYPLPLITSNEKSNLTTSR